jgi:hypothetical protein
MLLYLEEKMNQALYILNSDFFDRKETIDYDNVAEKIEGLTKTERIIMIYDPFCMKIFQKLASDKDESKLREIMVQYYGSLEKLDKHKLTWPQLSEFAEFHMDVMNEIMISVDFFNFSVSSIGCLPMKMGKKKLFLYFHINPYFEIPNKFYMIKERDYLKSVGDLYISEETT